MVWHKYWDQSFDLARGGIELSFRNQEDMSQLLVETEGIRLVNKIVDNIEAPSISSRYHVIGTRGFGKSTVLNYIAFRLYSTLADRKVLPAYSSLLGSAKDEKELELIFFRSLLESLFDIPSDLAKFDLSELLAETYSRLTQAKIEYKKQVRDFGHVTLEYVYTAFDNQLEHLRGSFRKIVFLIDGLDKQDTGSVLKFLRNTQERLNNLISKYKCIFVDAADPSWRETLDTKEFSGVRGSSIGLRVWAVDEVEALLERRLATIGIYQNPFERKALEMLIEDFQGNPREILQYCTTLLNYAAREHLAIIGPGIARKIVWSEDAKEKFCKFVISDADARFAFEKLRMVYSERQIMNILLAAFNQEGQRISKVLDYEARSSVGITVTDSDYQRYLEILLSRGCLRPDKPQNFLTIESDLKKLFDFVGTMHQSLVALPVILSELEFDIETVSPPLKEDIMMKEEIERVFEVHSNNWLTYNQCSRFLFENPRTRMKLEEHFETDSEKKTNATIPLVVSQLLGEGKLMKDDETSSYRWRPRTVDLENAEFFKHKDILDSIDSAEQAILEGENLGSVVVFCKKIFQSSFCGLNSLFENRINATDISEISTFLVDVGVNISKPLPLNLFLSSLEEKMNDVGEAGLCLQSAIVYARRILARTRQLRAYEPRNQEIQENLRKCKTGTLKEEERQYFREFLLPVLMKKYGKLVECMTIIKTKEGILENLPKELNELVLNKQLLQADIYQCPKCKKRTAISKASQEKVEVMNCVEDKVPLVFVKSGFVLSPKAYEAWNVWMEEYTRKILEKIPCKHVETGISLRPLGTTGVTGPEEVDLAVVFNGKSIAIECIEQATVDEQKNDVKATIEKVSNLGLFDSVVLILMKTNSPRTFDENAKKYARFLFTVVIRSPRDFGSELQQVFAKIQQSMP
jgi:hypothetical protein